MGKFKLPIFLLVLLGISVNNLKGQTTAYSNWYKVYNDTLQGINMEKALHFLQEKKLKPHRQIIVGIIDSGIDTTSVDLAPALWCNPKEKNDGKDNDKNGYADDLHGWNFLGTKDGAFNMTSAGTEEYREFKRLYPKYKNIDPADIQDTTEYAYYEKMKKKAGIMSYIKYVGYTAAKDQAYQLIDSVLTTIPGINIDTLTVNGLTHLPIEDPAWGNAYQTLFVDMFKSGKKSLWKDVHKQHRNTFALMQKRLYGIEHDADKRLLMGDDLKNPSDRFYGNSLLQAKGCDHGTFVAGVIAGQGINNAAITGVWPQARLMIIRAVPDGDEYDKDISTAIRYAVDNGAKVINMRWRSGNRVFGWKSRSMWKAGHRLLEKKRGKVHWLLFLMKLRRMISWGRITGKKQRVCCNRRRRGWQSKKQDAVRKIYESSSRGICWHSPSLLPSGSVNWSVQCTEYSGRVLRWVKH